MKKEMNNDFHHGNHNVLMKHWKKLVTVLSVIVALVTVSALSQPASTMTVLMCEQNEHVHSSECYTQETELICGQEEYVGHTHTEECYGEDGSIVCGQEETAGHVHTDDCYTTVNLLVCGNEEHTHTEECYTSTPDEPETVAEPVTTPETVVEPESDLYAVTPMMFGNTLGNSSDKELSITITQKQKSSSPNFYDPTNIVWEDFNPDTDTLKETDFLKFAFDYTIPGNAISESNHTISYQLPKGLKFPNEYNGQLMHGNTPMGKYTISTEGLLTLNVTNEDYIRMNENGHDLTGSISFESMINETEINHQNKLVLKFSDEIEYSINIDASEKGNISIQKNMQSINKETGEILYTLQVYSTEGTSGTVKITDTMLNNLGLKGNGNISSNPENIIIDKNVTDNASSFELTLKQMNAGDNWTIYYYAYIDPSEIDIDGVTLSNYVNATSINNKGKEIKNGAEISKEVKSNVLSKSKTATNPDGTFTWKITVNADNQDIGGWTLNDILNGEAFNGPVKISPAINGQEEITLPLTFPSGTTETYTITYTTTSDVVINGNQQKNKAILTPPEGSTNQPFEADGLGDWNGEAYNPISKTGVSIVPNEEKTEGTVTWNVEINSNKGKIKGPWTYYDNLWDGQWLTGAQLKDLANTIKTTLDSLNLNYSMIANYQIEPDTESSEYITVDFSNLDSLDAYNNSKFKTFTIKFENDLPKDQKINFTYQSTAPLTNVPENGKTFTNEADITDYFNNKVTSKGEVEFVPENTEVKLEKTDNEAVGNSGEDSSHEHTSKKQEIAWNLNIKIPNNYSGGAITLTDYLPDSLTLSYFEIRPGSITGIKDITNSGNHELNDSGYSVETKIDGNNVSCVIPESLLKDSRLQNDIIYFVIKAVPKDDMTWSKDSEGYEFSIFNNTAKIFDSEEKVIGEDSQKQTIKINDGNKVVVKKANTVIDNIIPYELTINPDYSKYSEIGYVELTDTLTFSVGGITSDGADWTRDVVLMIDSVKVYKVNSDGTKGNRLSNKEFSYTYEEINATSFWSDSTRILKIKINLPESSNEYTPYHIEYSYRVISELNENNFQVDNKAVLDGYSDEKDQDSEKVQVKSHKSQGTIDVDGIDLHKVNSLNLGERIPGAKFKLFQYDSIKQEYVQVYFNADENGEYTTDDNGTISFNFALENTAYKLVETFAPVGFVKSDEPYYFMVEDKEETEYSVPDDFDGVIYQSGEDIYFENTPIEGPKTEITVNKVWKNSDGTDKKYSENIQIKLFSKPSGSEVEWAEVGEYTIKVGTGSTWSLLIDNLPKYIDENVELLYKVEEIEVDGYDTSYSKNNLTGINSGEITITNTEKHTYDLPKTGGSGTSMYLFGGVTLMSLAILLLMKKNRKVTS